MCSGDGGSPAARRSAADFLVVRHSARRRGDPSSSNSPLRSRAAAVGDVHRLAAVRRAGQRDLLAGQLVLVDAAVLEERDGLKRLRGGTEAGAQARIAGIGEQAPESVDDRDRAGMERFDLRAAVDGREPLHGCNVYSCAACCAALRGHRFLFRAVDLEHGVELGELEELLDPLGGVDEDQLAVLAS